jgi:hypothetical protein
VRRDGACTGEDACDVSKHQILVQLSELQYWLLPGKLAFAGFAGPARSVLSSASQSPQLVWQQPERTRNMPLTYLHHATTDETNGINSCKASQKSMPSAQLCPRRPYF